MCEMSEFAKEQSLTGIHASSSILLPHLNVQCNPKELRLQPFKAAFMSLPRESLGIQSLSR